MGKLVKIFIVDDDEDIVLLVKKYLEYKGHKIIDYAFNGKEAIQKFKNFNIFPDLVLMDHRMPFKNGIQTTKEILKINPLTNIIFLSADITVREEAINLGVISFIVKPIKLFMLTEKIYDVFQKKKNCSSLESNRSY